MADITEVINVPDSAADAVLKEIDDLITWKLSAENNYERGMTRLAFLLAEAKHGAYWIRRGFHDEDEWLHESFKTLPRTEYYDLIRIVEDLGHLKPELIEQIGRSKARALCRVKRLCGGSIPENWVLHALQDQRDVFLTRVKELAGNSSKRDPEKIEEASDFMSFRLFGNQITVVREALKVAGLEGQSESTGRQLELIAADYLSGHTEDGAGRIENRNGLILPMVQRMLMQCDKSDPSFLAKLCSLVEHVVEACRVPEA